MLRLWLSIVSEANTTYDALLKLVLELHKLRAVSISTLYRCKYDPEKYVHRTVVFSMR